MDWFLYDKGLRHEELKLTIKTLEQGVKYVKVNNKDTRTILF